MSDSGKRMNGKALAIQIQEGLKKRIVEEGLTPGLAVILVGGRKDSLSYVRRKTQVCADLGISTFDRFFPEDVDQETLIEVVNECNLDDRINGILIQLPLPSHIDEELILGKVDPKKDVDGFSSTHIGELTLSGNPLFTSCTPKGIISMLDHYKVDLEGKHVVVVGRSSIVGKPIGLLCLHRNATLTICHSRTKDLAFHTTQADVLIAAVGRPEFIRGNMVKEGVVVIDVGINAIDAPERKSGYRLVGDVCREEVEVKASLISPVPGGVGPMTIASLMENVVNAHLYQSPVAAVFPSSFNAFTTKGDWENFRG